MVDHKIRIDFNEGNVLESVTYTLVSEFDLRPNVLRADIDGDGSGFMLLSIVGEEENVCRAMARIRDMGFSVRELSGHIIHDTERCWSCGACVSLCPTRSIHHEEGTMRVLLDTGTCIACGSCINACSVKAIQLEL
ncbi:MAG: 4Fe-4S binding protein [Candidatus Methanomethylophilaceae archaeon]|nr:4Fe-4S binding protein [Candidatus Methanomethylophilaceae archaeon]